MSYKNIKQDIHTFSTCIHEMNRTYEDFAKKHNFSYTTLQVINLITEVENCTQKIICDLTFLPKQTVNSIITGLYKEDLIELIVNPKNRRSKSIIFTDKGNDFIQKTMPQVREAELNAMTQLTEEERTIMLKGMSLFCKHLQTNMLTNNRMENL